MPHWGISLIFRDHLDVVGLSRQFLSMIRAIVMTFLDFVMFMLDVILGHTPLTSPLLSSVKAFRLRLYMDQMFRLHLHHIR